MKLIRLIIVIVVCYGLLGCTNNGVGKMFAKKSPYEQYKDKLESINMHNTALGQEWIDAGEKALQDSLLVSIPYKETGYFMDEKVRAVSYRFNAARGEVISIKLEIKSYKEGIFFLDLFERQNNEQKWKWIATSDSTLNIEHEVEDGNVFLLRLQPELLRGGRFDLRIETKPSLSFPVSGKNSKAVGSFFGVDRESGKRKHEGIDIFAPKGTPAVAATEGLITSVTQNRLGGKVVFLTNRKRAYSLYYAHLDSQLVKVGQKIMTGDTIGLVGNTGNARYTPPHLHFGIYTWGSGAIDPYPFVGKTRNDYPKVIGKDEYLNILARTNKDKVNLYAAIIDHPVSIKILEKNTLIRITGLTGEYYKVELPDRLRGYIKVNQVSDIQSPVSTHVNKIPRFVLDIPDSAGVVKDSILVSSKYQVLGKYEGFMFVDYTSDRGWIIK